MDWWFDASDPWCVNFRSDKDVDAVFAPFAEAPSFSNSRWDEHRCPLATGEQKKSPVCVGAESLLLRSSNMLTAARLKQCRCRTYLFQLEERIWAETLDQRRTKSLPVILPKVKDSVSKRWRLGCVERRLQAVDISEKRERDGMKFLLLTKARGTN